MDANILSLMEIVYHRLRSSSLCFAIGVAVVRVSGSHALEVG